MRQNCLAFIAATASLWPIPLVDLPLIDMTLSPLMARPSTEAGEAGSTRWTCNELINPKINVVKKLSIYSITTRL